MSTDSNSAVPQLIKIGTVVGLYGLKGELKIRSALNNLELLNGLKTVYLDPSNKDRIEATVSSLSALNNTVHLSLKEYPDRTAAEPLLNAIVYAAKSQLKALNENEWWINDLIGMEVFTTEGAHIGTVCDVFETNGFILEIRTKSKNTSLVPFVKELVPVVDIPAKRIEIVDLPGLIE